MTEQEISFVDVYNTELTLRFKRIVNGMALNFESLDNVVILHIDHKDIADIHTILSAKFEDVPNLRREIRSTLSPRHSIYIRKAVDNEIEIFKQYMGGISKSVVLRADNVMKLNEFLTPQKINKL